MQSIVHNNIFRILSTILIVLIAFRSDANEWQSLLDKDLSQWEVFLGVPHKSVMLPDGTYSESDDAISGIPLGFSDPLNVFSVNLIDKEPVLLISGQVYGGLTTRDEFENYHLSLQFRWGEKKWPPRLNNKRDSGILLHCVGEHGVFWNVWKRSLECQIQEGDCGDFIPLGGANASARVLKEEQEGHSTFSLNGELADYPGYTHHAPSTEALHGEWNLVDIYAIKDRLVFVVNGTPNMAIQNARQKSPDGQSSVPLTRGQIQIQSEAAEIEYRRIKIRRIDEFPESVAEMFNDK